MAGYPHKVTATVTTDKSGDGTGYTDHAYGLIHSVTYTKDATDPYANGVDFTITTETTAQNVWVDTNVNATETVLPRTGTHDTTGAALLYAAGGTAVCTGIAVHSERIKVVVAQGGDTKTGLFTVYLV